MTTRTRSICQRDAESRELAATGRTTVVRPIKPQPIGANQWNQIHKDYRQPWDDAFYPDTFDAVPALLKCPFGRVGDVVAGKEPWARKLNPEDRWRPAMTMSADAVRLRPTIVALRVEQQDSVWCWVAELEVR